MIENRFSTVDSALSVAMNVSLLNDTHGQLSTQSSESRDAMLMRWPGDDNQREREKKTGLL